jgi:2'-5' RNA ligase
MSPYRPFIEDPDDIVRFEGGRFVVLRATGEAADAHRHVCEVLREQLAREDVLVLTDAHVTLAGFTKGAELESIRHLVTEWARSVAPLTLEVEKAGNFPAPFQIVMLQIRKTKALCDALVSLRARATERELCDPGLIPAADWIFHMSVAYCVSLSGPAWAAVTKVVDGLPVPAAQCVVGQVEIVAIDNGLEYSAGVVDLGPPQT